MGIIKFSQIAVFALFANLSGAVSYAQPDSRLMYLLRFITASRIYQYSVLLKIY